MQPTFMIDRLVKADMSIADAIADWASRLADELSATGGSFRGPQTVFSSRRRDSGLMQP
jgi:hypothetical protein